jgi:phosphatidylglycerophosphatase C
MTARSTDRPVVAAFDVDGTLTRRDCVVPFLQRLAGVHGMLLAAARSPIASGRAAVNRDRDALKEVVVGGVYQGRDVSAVAATGKTFASYVKMTSLRSDTVDRLRWHQRMGHRTVIVSASLRSYLDPLAASLGIDHVLCTDVASDGGRYLGRLEGGNCRAAEKAVRLRALLTAESIEDAELWAYGDSRGDREMLDMAAHPVWVARTTVPAVPAEIIR